MVLSESETQAGSKLYVQHFKKITTMHEKILEEYTTKC